MKKMYQGKETYIMGVNTPLKINEYTHNKSNCSECMSGYFDDMMNWADMAWKKVSGEAQAIADSITAKGTQFYNQAENLYNQGQENVEKKMKEARAWVEKLKEKQRDVDVIIENTQNETEKQKLIAKRDDARGIFTEYILPLLDKLTSEEEKIGTYAGEAYQDPSVMMAALPFVPIAIGVSILSASSAIIYYAKKAYAIEEEILSDSSLSSEMKTKLLSDLRKTGSVQAFSGAIKSMQLPLIIGGLGFLLYKVTDRKK